MKRALLFGITGQQSSYLAEFLLQSGDYKVNGVCRPHSLKLLQINSMVNCYHARMDDQDEILKIVKESKPDEIYNLAAMNDLSVSFALPQHTMDINFGGFMNIVESVKELKMNDCKIFQALSSEMFGNPVETPQNENTRYNPRNPYGVSKLACLEMAKIYRKEYGLKIYTGIMYNNDSPRRDEIFLSKKVCKYAARAANRKPKEKLILGNLKAVRDFGYAKEFVEWMWHIVQYPVPDDFIMATGITHTVEQFVDAAFKYVDKDWKEYVETDKSLYRESETLPLVGDNSKSIKLLGFSPKTTFQELISIMMEHELKQYDK